MYLNCHSHFSLNYGILSPKELLIAAQARGISRLALTDINNTSGCMDFVRLAPQFGIIPTIGVDFRNGSVQEYVVLARNLTGFREANEFLSDIRMYKKPVPQQAPHLPNCIVIYPWHRQFALSLRDNEYVGIRPELRGAFHLYASPLHRSRSVVLSPVVFTSKIEFSTHRLLAAIRLNTVLSALPPDAHCTEGDTFFSNDIEQQWRLTFPAAIKNAEAILCDVPLDFQFGRSKNKKSFTGSEYEDFALLRQLAEEGLRTRYPTCSSFVRERFDKELSMIAGLDFTAYFLINWDIVSYAKSQGFFHQGRGSGANSLIAFCLDITNVDPIELDLYFERFINPTRKSPPDFDIDFSHTDRDAMRKYIFDKYPKRTALVGSYSTFEERSCIRELGKVFGLTDYDIKSLQTEEVDMNKLSREERLVLRYAKRIHGKPNLLSVHACGILISEEPITTYTALELMPVGFPSTQFSMFEAEDVGLYKYDILSQRGLGHIKDAVELVRRNRGIEIDIFDTQNFKKDPRINACLLRGDTVGCFYVESPAMRQLLRKLLVQDYEMLVAASSIIRPGVSSSGMMRQFIERYRYPERRRNAHPKLLEIMPDTFGVMVYQEDVLKVAHIYAGLTLDESDVMRRGMSGKFRSKEEFERIQAIFFENCKAKRYPDEEAAEIWRQVKSFAGYSFAKGHSASFAMESYQSLYLRAYYPIEFIVAVVNNFGGFYSSEFYLHEARMLGATVELPCINKSDYLCVLYGKTVYMGLCFIKDMEQKTIEAILKERKRGGEFTSLHNFLSRVAISLEQLRILIRIKAFRFIGLQKKELLWEAYMQLADTKKSVPAIELFEAEPETTELPELDSRPFEDALDEKQILGFFHTSPFTLLKKKFESLVYANELLQHVDNVVYIVGYFVADKIVRTENKEYMAFGCFIDSKGILFDTVHFPQSLKRSPFKGRACYIIKGTVITDFDVPCIDVSDMQIMEWIF